MAGKQLSQLSDQNAGIPEEITRLINDMRVHQVKLETQNEALRRIQQDLETSQRRYMNLYDFAPVAYFTLNHSGDIVEANLTAADLLGVGRDIILNRHFSQFVAEDDQSAFYQHLETLLKTQERQTSELKLVKATGEIIWGEMQSIIIENPVDRQIQCRMTISDITVRKNLDSAAREQRTLAEALRDTALALNSTLNLTEVLDRILANVGNVAPHDAACVLLVDENARTARVVGHSGSAMPNITGLAIADHAALVQMHRTGAPVAITDTRTIPGWISFHKSEFRTFAGAPLKLRGKITGFLTLHCAKEGSFSPKHLEHLQAFTDQAALAIENAQLLTKIKNIAALEERQRLARDLHDAVSQTLFSASMIAQALPTLWERQPAKARRRLAQLTKLTRGAMAEMRALLLELRPDALLEADISELLQYLTDAVMGRTEMKVTLEVDCPVPLPEDMHVAVYYVAQEALNNVVKHSRADEVTVSLHYRPDDMLRMYISDNGRGFAFDQIHSTALGLDIMRERAEAFGGQLKVVSEPGAGTLVVVSWEAKKR